jgi:hypothetical protein
MGRNNLEGKYMFNLVGGSILTDQLAVLPVMVAVLAIFAVGVIRYVNKREMNDENE